MDNLLSLHNLEVRFPAGRGRLVRVMDGVTLDIRRGETAGAGDAGRHDCLPPPRAVNG